MDVSGPEVDAFLERVRTLTTDELTEMIDLAAGCGGYESASGAWESEAQATAGFGEDGKALMFRLRDAWPDSFRSEEYESAYSVVMRALWAIALKNVLTPIDAVTLYFPWLVTQRTAEEPLLEVPDTPATMGEMDSEDANRIFMRAAEDELYGFMATDGFRRPRVRVSQEAILDAARVLDGEMSAADPEWGPVTTDQRELLGIGTAMIADKLEMWWWAVGDKVLTRPDKRDKMVGFIEGKLGRPIELPSQG